MDDTLCLPGSFKQKAIAKREYWLFLPEHVRFEIGQLGEVKPGMLLYRE